MNQQRKGIRQPVRIVLVVDRSAALADYQALLIERLRAEETVELVGKVAGKRKRASANIPILAKAVLAVEKALVRQQITPVDTRTARQILDSLPTLDADAVSFDLALGLGDHSLLPEDLRSARFGEWALSFEGSAAPDQIAICSDIRSKPRVRVEIVVRTAEDAAPRSLRRTSYNPKPGAVLTGAFIAEKAVLFLLHTVRMFADATLVLPELRAALPRAEPPGPVEIATYWVAFVRTSAWKLSEKWRSRYNSAREYWRVSFGTGSLTELQFQDASEYPACSHVMADPFLFEHQGEIWMFYEAMNANERAGWIEAVRLAPPGTTPPAVALQCAYHLSFPFVFRFKNDIFMMPETQQANRLEIWRATDFPTGWTLHATAFEGQQLAESSMFCADDGQWWLLTNLSDHHSFQDHSSELYLYAVDGPDLTSIRPHACNPVVIGSDTARNGGAIIRHQGRLFRPAQNNSYGIYGYGLNLMEIVRLDATGYEERLVRAFTPTDKPGSVALHHLSVSANHYVFDWAGR